MSILRDIMDLVKDINATDIEKVITHTNPKSLSKASSEGTLQFPNLVTRSLDVSTLNMICAAQEKEFASFAQIAMTMNQVANIKDGARGYLRKFHQNTGVSYTKNDFMNDVLLIAANEGVEIVASFETTNGATFKVTESNKQGLFNILEHLNAKPLNDVYIPQNYGLCMETVKKPRDMKIDNTYNGDVTNVKGNQTHNVINNSPGKYETINTSINEKHNYKHTDVLDRKPFNGHNILKDNDVKKANELVPTTLHIRILIVNDDQDPVGTQDFIIGVKAVMHPIKSEEIIENVYNGCKKNGPFFEFVRWTSGETSFMKDLILQVNEVKQDVFNKSSGASSWWIRLKRLKNVSKLRNKVFLPGGLLPNASIIMTADEVEYIHTRYGYDLMKEDVAKKVMDEYFLLSFVIVDTSSEIAHFLYDGQLSYQSVTFEGLRRENSSKNNINDVVKMANRLRI